MTPPIPDEIRHADFKKYGYENALMRLPSETRLFGTEGLYGDWNGSVLLLAKDFAPSSLLEERIADGCNRPYRHDPGYRTNTVLGKLAAPLLASKDPNRCGVLYGSALGCLMRDDGKKSGALPSMPRAMEFAIKIVRFTIENMPHLRVVVCLGDVAWSATAAAFGQSWNWSDHRDGRRTARAQGFDIVAAYHPVARVSRAKMQLAWGLIYDLHSTRRIAA